jgi:hypothetical protein
MSKLMGTIRITPNPGSTGVPAHFEIVFVPYHGRLDALTVRVNSHEELTAYLMSIKISEDEAAKWAGKARSLGLVLISGFERSEAQLRDYGLLK